MLADPSRGSKVWEMLDREISESGKNHGQIVVHGEFQSAAAFHHVWRIGLDHAVDPNSYDLA
jgi:hypothetical protein